MKYLIKRGDTLSEIAQRYGVSVDALVRANPMITDPNKIYAGRTLNVPVSLWKRLAAIFK